MPDFRQRVINLFQNCTHKIAPYAISLAVSSHKRTYAGIARSLDLKYHVVRDHAPQQDEDFFTVADSLIAKVKKHQTVSSPGLFICDFTRLAKSKDAKTPMTTWDRDGRINATNNGFSAGFCLWTNGSITIPVSFLFWTNKNDSSHSYVSKSDCVQAAIKKLSDKLDIKEVIVDGEFSSSKMLEFFADHKINVTARVRRNRKVITDDGVEAQLQLHPHLRLLKNSHSRSMRAKLQERYYWFTAVKQTTRGGKKKIVFIISTKERQAKEHVKIYGLRWNCEKFFRTAKQSLGLEDCQSQKIDGISGHIWSVMMIFTALEETRFFKKKKSVERVLAILKSKNTTSLVNEYIDLVETYVTF